MYEEIENKAFQDALKKSNEIWENIKLSKKKYKVLTGERPTGPLHLGHYFGTLQNRVDLQKFGVELNIIIADYQVLTDRDVANNLNSNVLEILLDYLAIGLDPVGSNTLFFTHSHVPALNQLLIPFLSLITTAELERNPTVKSEIQNSQLKSINSLMFTYPLHQAADILFCHGNLVPGGKDQLPHIELAREVARKFNDRYCKEKAYFQMPDLLLSDSSNVLGLDGKKMSKSLNNSIMIKHTEDETAKLIKGAKTDSLRTMFFDANARPEVSNLLKITSLCSNLSVDEIAAQIGEGGSGKLKSLMTDAVNAYFSPIRERRKELAKDPQYVLNLLKSGNEKVNHIANQTLSDVLKLMGMKYY